MATFLFFWQINLCLGGDAAALDAAIRAVDIERVRDLAADVDLNTAYDGKTPLQAAVFASWKPTAKHVVMARILLDAGADVNLKAEWLTPIYVASLAGDPEMIKLLAQRGANLDVPNSRGATPLFMAALRIDLDAVRVLLNLGAKVNAATDYGWTPLMVTKYDAPPGIKREDQEAIVELFSKSGGKEIDSPEFQLWMAAGEGNLKQIEALVKGGADINRGGGSYSRTPVQRAIRSGRYEAMRLLVRLGADLEGTNYGGDAALMEAADSELSVVNFLLAQGANPNTPNDCGLNAVAWSTIMEEKDIFHKLMDTKPDMGYANSERKNRTYLMYAAREGATDKVKRFLAAGVDVNLYDDDGRNALWYAVKAEAPEVLALLRAAGIDMQHHDKKGQTALDYARELKREKLVVILAQAEK